MIMQSKMHIFRMQEAAKMLESFDILKHHAGVLKESKHPRNKSPRYEATT